MGPCVRRDDTEIVVARRRSRACRVTESLAGQTVETARREDFARRRLDGEPVARILGLKEFWGRPLQLSAATLVPRPDTETVVELALEMLRAAPAADHPLRIADIGTGSGAILLALLSAISNWPVAPPSSPATMPPRCRARSI